MCAREGWTKLKDQYIANIRKQSILRYSDKLLDQISSFQSEERTALRDALDKMDKEFRELTERRCPACNGDGIGDSETGKCKSCYGSGKTPLNMRDYHVYFEARESAQKQLNRSYGIADRVDIAVDVLSLMPRRTEAQDKAEIDLVKCSPDDIIPEYMVDDSAQEAPGEAQEEGQGIGMPPETGTIEDDQNDPPQKSIERIDKLESDRYIQSMKDDGFIQTVTAIYVQPSGDSEGTVVADPLQNPLPTTDESLGKGGARQIDPPPPTQHPTPYTRTVENSESVMSTEGVE
jgi:hypothetical protein